jgi:hypothetical protein
VLAAAVTIVVGSDGVVDAGARQGQACSAVMSTECCAGPARLAGSWSVLADGSGVDRH